MVLLAFAFTLVSGVITFVPANPAIPDAVWFYSMYSTVLGLGMLAFAVVRSARR